MAGSGASSRRVAGSAGPLLVTVSGMDGAGKSTAVELLRDRLRAAGLAAEVSWTRLGSERELLDRVATPVKRLLGREGTVADPVAAGGPAVTKVRHAREGAGRRTPIAWAWIAIVAWTTARSYRRAAGARRRGTSIVCDRWATDALVDLELRYGRHRLGRTLLRRLPPRPDLSILLEIDAVTARARKPGDQADRILAEMERLYATEAVTSEIERVDARLPRDAVARRLTTLVDALLVGR